MGIVGRSALLALALALLLVRPAPAEDAPDGDAAARDRLQFMGQLLERFQLTYADDPDAPLMCTEEPVLRYTNPVRGVSLSDGTLYLWLDDHRPMAAVSLSIRGQGNVSREVTSFASDPLVLTRDEAPVWTPASGGLLDRPFPDEIQAASSEELRLIQMRKLARRFSGDFRVPTDAEATEMRLLSQPVYRYASEKHGVVDGALFALTEANDPEMLLRLELVRKSPEAEPMWRYSLARMSSVIMHVRLDGEEVWSTAGYWRGPRTPEDPYMEVSEGKYPPAE